MLHFVLTFAVCASAMDCKTKALCMADASTWLPECFVEACNCYGVFDKLASSDFDAMDCGICLRHFSKPMLTLKRGLFAAS